MESDSAASQDPSPEASKIENSPAFTNKLGTSTLDSKFEKLYTDAENHPQLQDSGIERNAGKDDPKLLDALSDKNVEPFSGAGFNPIIHQSRRDMYGGEIKMGIPKNFQHILYDLSNVIIKESNYGMIDEKTGKVFNDAPHIYSYLAAYLEFRLSQRQVDPQAQDFDLEGNEGMEDRLYTSATAYMSNKKNKSTKEL